MAATPPLPSEPRGWIGNGAKGAEEIIEITGRAFQVYGRPLELLMSFKYLGG